VERGGRGDNGLLGVHAERTPKGEPAPCQKALRRRRHSWFARGLQDSVSEVALMGSG
jgi:hypothetical protein